MATIPPVSLGINPGTRATLPHSPKSAAGHVDHVEDIATAGQDTEPKSRLGLKNVETEAYVVEQVKAGFKLVPIVLDEVRPDEVLVEMKYSGVCR